MAFRRRVFRGTGSRSEIAVPSAGPGTPATPPPVAATPDQLPYVYTKWKHFTVEDGLPNDHIFAVKADGNRVWVGTDDGLALIDKKAGKVVRVWKEKDGLPWRVITGIEVDPKTGDVWLGLFGRGLARLSGGRFDHFHQLNSGLVNDVVYAITMENDNVWAATTAGSSRYNTKTKEWAVFTEKNAPMEEIWNYNVAYNKARDKMFIAVWGSGVLEFDCKKDREQKGDPWKVYLDPDGEMEIDLYRDDGIIHVITTGVSPVADVFWVSSYFGCCRYDGRHWRGFYAHETGLPSDFTNNVRARSVDECWFAHDKGVGVVADFPTETVVAYTRDPQTLRGKAQIYRVGKAAEDGRHARGGAAEFRHLHRPRRQRHLGGDGQRPRLGDRRRILRRPEVEPGLARRSGRKPRTGRPCSSKLTSVRTATQRIAERRLRCRLQLTPIASNRLTNCNSITHFGVLPCHTEFSSSSP